MTTLKTSHGRPLMAVFATTLLVAAAILAGCGSGGSGDTPVPPPPPITPTPVNAVMTTSVTPADGATSVARDTKLTAVFTANTGTFASTTASLSCGGVSQTITASMPVASGKMTTVTWAAASPLPYSATCTYQVLGTAAGVDGGAQANTNTRGTFTVEQLVCKTGEAVSADGQTCVAVASWWPPKNVAPIGVKTYNPGVFPMDGLLSPEVGGVIWQKAVIDGTIKFAETGMILTGFSPEPLLLAFFLNPYLKNVCTTLVYKKNGASIYPDKRTYGGCKTDVFDWIVGTTDGYISHFLTADLGRKTNVCYKESWDGVNQRGVATEVTCP